MEAEIAEWMAEVGAATERIGPRFRREELRGRAGQYLRGLVSRVERKNGWQLSEQVGEETPTNLQHFIARACWDADLVRDDLRSYVFEHLGEPDGVLVVDETGFLKKGDKSVGVKRQYSGTAGRVENCQIGVFLSYKSCAGHALIDRELYLPKEWADDVARRNSAKVPESVEFATKPKLARRMLERALAAGAPAKWVTADEVYGSDHAFRRFLEERRVGYVVAITSAAHLFLNFKRTRVDQHLKELPSDAWQRLSCGQGSKGDRIYDWTLVTWTHHEDENWTRGWLVRRSIENHDDVAHYYIFAPRGTSFETIVRIAGSRWSIEECFEQAKQETGLAHYECRSWDGWHRHVTLSMLAHATLAVIRFRARGRLTKKRRRTSSR
jgi:SRSO17 transposase